MEIPSEIIESGTLTVYLDTPPELEDAAKAYNRQMSEYRRKMKQIRSLNTGFFVINVLMVIGIALSHYIHGLAVQIPGWYDLARFFVFLAIFVIFAVFDDKFWIPTAVSLTLLDIDPLFGLVTVTDLVLTLIHIALTRRMKPLSGYPQFMDIRIVYEKTNAPKMP